MTPAQFYAQERLEAENLIRQFTPDDELHDELIARIRPAIAFDSERIDDAEIPLGASKFGGAPDVADDFNWPLFQNQPLSFVAQINLDEIAPFDIEGVFPPSGLLSFFAPFGAIAFSPTIEVFRFARADHRLALLWDQYAFKSVKLAPTIVASLLHYGCAEFYEKQGEPELKGRAAAFDCDYEEMEFETYQLLGYPDAVQNDPRYDSDEANWREWRLLFQVGEDDQAQTMWGDAGQLYWTIRARDLQNHDFTDCRFHFDSC